MVGGAESLMSVAETLASLQGSHLATTIRNSLYLFPLIESSHVIGLTMVFGTIAVIDFRLLGLASTRRPFSRVASDIFKWTWAAFGLTVLTGLLMFITNAGVYYNNFYFRSKMVLLLLAGLNMLMFELTAGRKVQQWDTSKSAPASGKAVATVSILLWVAIIFVGRWIGFTTTRATPPTETDINIEDLLPK
jgi:uncharacterized protein DUF6644